MNNFKGLGLDQDQNIQRFSAKLKLYEHVIKFPQSGRNRIIANLETFHAVQISCK